MTAEAIDSEPSARRFARYFLAFTVGIGVALAPYLGAVNVPGFRALFSILPVDIRNIALPISSAVCGIVALYTVTIWMKESSRRNLSHWFRRWIQVSVVTLSAFVIATLWFSVGVVTDGGAGEVRFTVGPAARPTREPCPPNVSDETCIRVLTFDPGAIRGFWGDRSVRLGQAAILFSYVGFVGCLGGAIGQGMSLGRSPSRRRNRRPSEPVKPRAKKR